MTTYVEARDIMLKVFYDVWQPTGFHAVYTDTPGDPPTSDGVWARATLRHAAGKQCAFGDDKKDYERTGQVFVQVFAPKGDGLTQATAAAQLVANAFEDAKGLDVWFRNVHLREAGSSGAFEQINVVADFYYTEVR